MHLKIIICSLTQLDALRTTLDTSCTNTPLGYKQFRAANISEISLSLCIGSTTHFEGSELTERFLDDVGLS